MVNKTLNNKSNTYVGSNNDDIIRGLGGHDSIFGSNGDDTILGGDGDDILRAGRGNDKLLGGDGDDFLTVYSGHEIFDGGRGLDFIDFYYAATGVEIDLRKNSTRFDIGSSSWQVDYQSIEAVYGSRRGDEMIGNSAQNILRGEKGNDRLSGMGGDDLLQGGEGRDTLSGGDGRDFFIFYSEPTTNNFDTLTDFAPGNDRFMLYDGLYDLDGVGKTMHERNASYQQIKASQFQSGEEHVAENADVRIIYDSRNGVLYFDENGSRSGGLSAIADLGEDLNLSANSIFVYDV